MLSLYQTLDYRSWLAAEFELRKARDARTSYRQWGQRVQMDGSLLMRVLRGKAHLSMEQVERFGFLFASPVEWDYFKILVAYGKAKSAEEARRWNDLLFEKRQLGQREMSIGHLEVLGDARAVALLSLVELETFVGDPQDWGQRVAHQLIPRATVEECLLVIERLKRLGLLVEDDSTGRWVRADRHLALDPELAEQHKEAVRAYHRRVLEHVLWSIEALPSAQRDLSVLTCSLPASALPELREKLGEWRKWMAKYSDRTQGDSVWTLSLQLVPWARMHAMEPLQPLKDGADQ